MFKIGEKVLYPMHGAGTIENIEDRTVLGETRQYYILRIIHGNMQVMVPVNGSEQAGLRGIVAPEVFKDVIDVLKAASTEMDENWNRRNRDNLEKIKTGNIKEVAAVVRNLTRIDRIRKLSTGEKKLLANAKQILSSEISLATGKTEADILEQIEQAI